MALLVHIADEKHSARIRRGGIVPGKVAGAVYFMPVVQNHFISHQWLRELKRGGAKVLVGVYFRLPDDTLVWSGRYNQPHRQMALSEAIGELNTIADPLGFEMFIEEKVMPDAIVRVRHLPQVIGWRYMPNAHDRRPCPCPSCLRRGEVGRTSIIEKYDPPTPRPAYADVVRQIQTSTNIDDLQECLWSLQTKRRKANPEFMERLLDFENDELLEDVATTLGHYRHPRSKELLARLISHPSALVREAAAASMNLLSPAAA